MRFTTFVLGAALIPLALLAQAPGPARPVPVPVPPSHPVAGPTQPPERSVIGTLEDVNVPAMQIVVASSSGRRTLHLQAGLTIRQGSKTIKVAELPAHKGERVKVRYRESGGVQRAAWIVLASPPAAPPRHSAAESQATPAPGAR